MALVCLLYYCAVQHNINVCIIHAPGVCNDIADSLSRFQMQRFRKLAPKSNSQSDIIPAWPTQAFMNASCSASVMEFPRSQDKLTNQALQDATSSVASTTLQPSRHHL